MKNVNNLLSNLNIVFKNSDYLQTALTHRSYLNEHRSLDIEHNERMEFLGDAVLELVTTDWLYHNYDNPEGELTNWRASLVNAKMLSEVANEIGLEPYIRMSKGEAQDSNTKARSYILANALEAFIGAIYLDQGYEACRLFISQHILKHLPFIIKHQLYKDPKSKFQEKSQELLGITPTYKVLEESGPDHAKFFKVGIYLKKDLIAEGIGTSKQEAQVAAAGNAIKIKNW
jgi:ribonuclease-3